VIIETKIPIAVTKRGYHKLSIETEVSPTAINEAPETTNEADVDSAKEPNKSDPIPATSPTLSPTLSATVAGFFGESSSRDYSTLPTKSAPTSAALV